MLSVKYDVIPIMVLDPLDIRLPDIDCQIMLQDPYTSEEMLINPKLAKPGYDRNARIREIEITKTFKDYDIELLKLSTEEDFSSKLIDYMNKIGAA